MKKTIRKFRSKNKEDAAAAKIPSSSTLSNNNNNNNSNNKSQAAGESSGHSKQSTEYTEETLRKNNKPISIIPSSTTSSSTPSSPPKKGGFKFRVSPTRKKNKNKNKNNNKNNNNNNSNSNSNNNSNSNSNNQLKESLLATQEEVLSPLRGNIFDLADHKIYGISVDDLNDDSGDDSGDGGGNGNGDGNNTELAKDGDGEREGISQRLSPSHESFDSVSKFEPLANVKLKEFTPPDADFEKDYTKQMKAVAASTITSTTSPLSNNGTTTTTTTTTTFRNKLSSPDEVHALNKKKRNDYRASQRSNNILNINTNITIATPSTNRTLAYFNNNNNNNNSSNNNNNNNNNNNKSIYKSPPILLPPRIDSKGSSLSGGYSFSASSNNDGDSGKYSLSYDPWSPLNDLNDDHNDNDNIDDHNINEDDNDYADLSFDESNMAHDGTTTSETKVHGKNNDSKEKDDNTNSKQESFEQNSPFPNDPFADLKDEDGNYIVISSSGESNDVVGNESDNNKEDDNIINDDSNINYGEEIENDDDNDHIIIIDDENSNTYTNQEQEEQSQHQEVPITTTIITATNDENDAIISSNGTSAPFTTSPHQSPLVIDTKSLKSHPGSIHINGTATDASVSSSIGESIELLSNLHILSMVDFLKLNDAQRIQAYRVLSDRAAETVTDIDEKRTEIFTMGRQVDELSHRVTDLMAAKTKSKSKINQYKNEIKKFKETTDVDEKLNSLMTELDAKNLIIDALKEAIDQHTSPLVTNEKAKVSQIIADSTNDEGKAHLKSRSNVRLGNAVKGVNNRSNKEESVFLKKKSLSKLSPEKSVKERVKEFEQVGFGAKLEEMKNNHIENEELSSRLNDLVMEAEPKDSIIDELKVSLENQRSTEEGHDQNKTPELHVSSKSLSDEEDIDIETPDLRTESPIQPLSQEEGEEAHNVYEEEKSNELIENLKRQVHEQEIELARVKEELNNTRSEKAARDERVEEMVATLEEQQQIINTLNDAKMRELQSLKEDHMNISVDNNEHYQPPHMSHDSLLKDLQGEIHNKEEALKKVQAELEEMKEENIKKTEFYQNELSSVQDNFVHSKVSELERTVLEKEVLSEKLKEIESKCAENESLMERITTLEQSQIEKDKRLESFLDLEERLAEKEKQTEKIQEFDTLQSENEKLTKKVKELQVEIDDVSGLLEETFKSVKETEEINSDTTLTVTEQNCTPGRAAALFRIPTKRFANNEMSNQGKKQLERMCIIHQQTVIRQIAEINKLQEILDEKDLQLNELRIQATQNEEKISVLETQFIELNKAQENKNTPEQHLDAKDNTDSRILQIDKGYIESIQIKAAQDVDLIEELKNQISVLQSRNEKLNEDIGIDDNLRHDIEDLKSKLKAKELIASSLENAYNEYYTKQEKRSNCDDDIGEASVVKMDSKNKILSLQKTVLLQEKQNATIRRVQDLVQKIGERKEEEKGSSTIQQSSDKGEEQNEDEEKLIESSKNFSIIVSLSDKLSLLHEYLKVSLHLLDHKMSNDVYSLSSTMDADAKAEINIRFKQTIEALKEIKSEMTQKIHTFEKEVIHQNIKIVAKDGIIENLLQSDERLSEKVIDLQSQLEVFKDLSSYSSINLGVMTRFQECMKLEKELQEKDEKIKRLNFIIMGEVNPDA